MSRKSLAGAEKDEFELPSSANSSPLSRHRSGGESAADHQDLFLSAPSQSDLRRHSDGEYLAGNLEQFKRQGALASQNTQSAYAKKKRRSPIAKTRAEQQPSGSEYVGMLEAERIKISLSLDGVWGTAQDTPKIKAELTKNTSPIPKRFAGTRVPSRRQQHSKPATQGKAPVHLKSPGAVTVGGNVDGVEGSSAPSIASAGTRSAWRRWETRKSKGPVRRRVWTTQQEKLEELMALAAAASNMEEEDEEEEAKPAPKVKETQIQAVVREARREVMKLAVADGDEQELSGGKHQGYYLRKMPGKAHSVASIDGEGLDVAMHRLDEGRWGLKARTLDSEVLLSCERPVFFTPTELLDPAAVHHNRRRMFKRDGTVRDRFKGGESEAELRNRHRSASCPPLSLPVATLVALEKSVLSSLSGGEQGSEAGSARGSDSALSLGTTEKSPSRGGMRTPLREFGAQEARFFPPMELDKARGILETEFVLRPIQADEVPPMTPLVNTELVLERLRKGQSAWDPVLLGGRQRHVLPKVHKSEPAVGGSHVDTSEMSTSAMIQAHLNMLDRKATEITEESVGQFESDQQAATDSLHADSRSLVQMWEDRLVELRRIRAEVMELSQMSAPVKAVTERMQHEQLRISAVLRTGTESRIPRILASPAIASIIPKHPESFKSVKRRQQLQALSAKIHDMRGPLAVASRDATELFVKTMEQISPLEATLQESLANATRDSPVFGKDDAIVDRRQQGGADVNALHVQIAKIHHAYAESKELVELDRVAQELLDEMVELDKVANLEEKVINDCHEQANMQQALDQERRRVEEWNDLTKKIDWCWNDNTEEIGKRALHSILAITRRILAQPDVIEHRTVSSNSRVSVIQHILEARWGADVMTAFGFYHTKFSWCVPTTMPLEKMTYGCKYLCKRLDVPDHLLTLFLQRRTTTVPMELVKGMLDGFAHLQEGEAIFQDSSSDEENASPLMVGRAEAEIQEEEEEEEDLPNKPPAEHLSRRRKGYMDWIAASGSEDEGGSDKEAEGEDADDENAGESNDGASQASQPSPQLPAGKDAKKKKKSRKPSAQEGLGLLQFHGNMSPNTLRRFRAKRKSIVMGAMAGADGKMVSYGDEGHGELEVVDVDQDALRIQEEALEKLFDELDDDKNGFLTVTELKTALRRFRISLNRTSAKEMLAEVGSSGEKGLVFGDFLAVMRRLLAEGQEDDPNAKNYDELEDDQRTKVTAMLRKWLSQRASNTFTKWQAFVEGIAQKKVAVIDNYRTLCGYLRTSPGISTVLQDWLQSRNQMGLDLSKRGLSVAGMKACVFALYGWRPDFDLMEDHGEDPMQALHQTPADGYKIPLGDGIDVFTLRQDSCCGALHVLDVSDNDFRAEGTRDLVHLLTKCCKTLEHFDISGNNIGEVGAEHISNLLQCAEGSHFTHFKLARNRLGDIGGEVVMRAIVESEQRKSIKVLDISHNEIGEMTAEMTGRLLEDHKSALTELDLSWNLIRLDAAVPFFEGLRVNRVLKVLDIQWNGLGSDAACHRLGEALKVCMLERLNVGHCGILGTGAHLISPGLKKNTALKVLILDGNNIKQVGARALYKATCHSGRPPEERLHMSTVDCNLGILDSLSFNKSEPAGKYSLDMSSPYDRVTFMELMHLVWEGKGMFMAFPAPQIDEKYVGDFRPYTIKPPETSEEDDWWIPEKGLLEFSYGSLRSTLQHQEAMTKDEMSQLESVLDDPEKKERDRIDAIRAFCEGDTFLRFEQVKDIIDKHLRENRSAERVELVRQCYNRLIEAEMAPDLLDLLNQNERLSVERHLGVLARTFTKNNPTGFYRLDLSKKPQRDICLRLFELQNSQREVVAEMEAYYAARAGGPRPDLDRTWRNGKIDGEAHTHSCDWAIPHHGFLEVDFVQIVKPNPTLRPAEAEFELLQEKLDLHNAALTRIQIIRDWSNRNLLSCSQVHQLLRLFSMETEQALRVEVLVVAFARTVDWHGYRNLLQIITGAEQESLVRRLGATNLFDEVMAVGYYECDLAMPDQRFVAQELVHLALVEPGENCVDTQYNGVDLSIPSGWGKELPRRGLLSMYYCREQECIDKVDSNGSWNQSNPPFTVDGAVPEAYKSTFTVWFLKEFCAEGHTQPAGTEWVRKYRMRRIKIKMMKLAANAEEMFSLLDTDGGGTLDRKELAMGLFRLGVWLHPSEMQALVDALDEDGGGTIDLDEFETFWSDNALDRDWELPKGATLRKQERVKDLLSDDSSPGDADKPSNGK